MAPWKFQYIVLLWLRWRVPSSQDFVRNIPTTDVGSAFWSCCRPNWLLPSMMLTTCPKASNSAFELEADGSSRERLCIPRSMTKKVLELAHDCQSHVGYHEPMHTCLCQYTYKIWQRSSKSKSLIVLNASWTPPSVTRHMAHEADYLAGDIIPHGSNVFHPRTSKRKLFQLLNTKLLVSTAYHPQTDGTGFFRVRRWNSPFDTILLQIQ